MSNTVLICDDTMFMRMVIRRVLESNGYTVVGEAETGSAAVARYAALRPDVVTMDVVMPDHSGIDAIRQIRAADPNARVIMCSALGQSQLLEAARAAGAAGFVMKPFQAHDLITAVEGALQQHGACAPAGVAS
jgi:two-component system chemotaxis response regulator CheY